ncbi:MAG: hypothetical protein Q9191_001559, partial [Dirinaria sp. TL-2023a]
FRGGRGGKRGGGQRSQRADYEEIPKHNTLFEEYYNDLKLVPENERESFWAALRRELPNSFRFTGSKAYGQEQRLIDRYVPEIAGTRYNDEPVDPPTPIPWFPDQLAWQMTTTKNVVRRMPQFASFQKFLVSETSVGNISRQEAVSMIPPLLMGVEPGMVVLDMCAAPGSKTAQLIEMIHGGEEARMRKIAQDSEGAVSRGRNPDAELVKQNTMAQELGGDWSDDGRTTGLLVANDSDYKRAQMLIHQVKRLSSPNLIVTNHDATSFPSFKLPSEPSIQATAPTARYVKFDRILADVPCSGDGTARKNVNVWKDWNPANGLGLFPTQVRILVRALQMLKVGGRVVYSTCSMNPVENEAVIASAIERCGGSSQVDIVDCTNLLPKLKRQPGLTSWKLMDKKGQIWQSWSDFEKEQLKNGLEGLGRVVEAMFPLSENKQALPLERCMRIYPHLQDTGGFFITVLEKKKEIRARPESENKKIEPKPPIIATVDEIAAKPVNETNLNDKINALDSLLLPEQRGSANLQSAAARQNQGNVPDTPVTAQKREFDAGAEAEVASKRLRTREPGDAVQDPTPQGAADRMVHWPPPPGAELEITRPMTPSKSKSAQTVPNSGQSKPLPNALFEEPFKYLPPDQPELQFIQRFYRLSPKFPMDRFMVRNALGNPAKTIYYTSALARSVLTENEGKGLKFVHCGIKMFVKQDVQRENVCKWRIQTEGLPLLEPWVGEERIVKLWSRRTLRKLLVEMFPKVDGDGWKDLGEIGERMRDAGMGCYVLRSEPRVGDDGFDERMILPLWRSLYSLNLMLPKEDRKAMLLRLYNEDTPLMDHSKHRFIRKSGPNSDPLRLDPASELEVEEAAAAEQLEKFAVVIAPDDTNLRSEDEEEEGGVALEASGFGADPTGMGSGEDSRPNMENYGSSTGVDNVEE